MTGPTTDENNDNSKYKPFITKTSEEYLRIQIKRALEKLENYLKSVSESYESLAKNGNVYAKKLNETLKEDLKKIRKHLKFFKGSKHLVKGLNYADLINEINKDYEKYGLTKTLGIHGPAEILAHTGGFFTRIATIPVQEAYKDWARGMDSWKEVKESFKDAANRFQDLTKRLAKNFEGLNKLELSIDTQGHQKALNNFNSQMAELPEQLIIISKIIEQRKIDAAEAAREEALEELGVYDDIDDIEDIDDIDISDYGDTQEVLDVHGEIVDTDSGDYGPTGGNSFNGELLSFASGGIVPGDSSQPVTVMAHGSEMILNNEQMANLISRLKIRERFGDGEIFVYSPVIDAGNTKEELMDALNRSSMEFLSLVAEKEAQRKLKMA